MTSAVTVGDRLVELLLRPVVQRILSGVAALGTGTVLGIATQLTPAVDGHGTHTQLGLSDCSFLVLTGAPCPMCGATTTFTLLAHLHVVQGVVNQPFAAVLFALTVFVFAVSVSEVVLPRARWERLFRVLAPYEGPLAAGFLVMMALGWLYKIWLMGIEG